MTLLQNAGGPLAVACSPAAPSTPMQPTRIVTLAPRSVAPGPHRDRARHDRRQLHPGGAACLHRADVGCGRGRSAPRGAQSPRSLCPTDLPASTIARCRYVAGVIFGHDLSRQMGMPERPELPLSGSLAWWPLAAGRYGCLHAPRALRHPSKCMDGDLRRLAAALGRTTAAGGAALRVEPAHAGSGASAGVADRDLAAAGVTQGATSTQWTERGSACGGSGEIRTHERVTPSAVFKTAAFNRSATLPVAAILPSAWRGLQPGAGGLRRLSLGAGQLDHVAPAAIHPHGGELTAPDATGVEGQQVRPRR